MADTKISALTAATTPLAGTEVLPIVQSSTTKKVAVSDLTAGRSVSAASLSLTTTPLAVTSGGTGLATVAQGDLLYGSASNTLSALAKNTTATRYLANTGTSNNPAWAQIDLTNGVTGTLPTTNGGTGLASFTANGVVYASSTSALATGSAITFDGTNFATTGTVSGTKLIPTGGAVAGNGLYLPSANNVALTTNGAVRIASDDKGNTQFNSTTSYACNIYGGLGELDVMYNMYRDGSSWKYGANGYATRYTGGVSGSITHAWYNYSTGTAGNTVSGETTVLSINTSNNVIVDAGNLVIGTSGKGIDFSATASGSGTMTSELLADYEEGTWTPGYAPDTGSFTSITYNSTVGGKYVKIGTTCFITGYINTSTLNVTGASGAVLITGLPFAIAANSSGKRDNWGGGSIGYSVTFTGQRPTDLFTTGNSSNLTMTYRDSATSDSAYLDVTDLYTAGSGNEIAFSMVYKTS